MNTLILSFLRNYWALLIGLAVAVALCLNNALFGILGTLIYLPALVLGSAVSALLVKHLFFRETIDAEIDSGRFLEAWRFHLHPQQRAYCVLVVLIALYIGACIIASGLIK